MCRRGSCYGRSFAQLAVLGFTLCLGLVPNLTQPLVLFGLLRPPVPGAAVAVGNRCLPVAHGAAEVALDEQHLLQLLAGHHADRWCRGRLGRPSGSLRRRQLSSSRLVQKLAQRSGWVLADKVIVWSAESWCARRRDLRFLTAYVTWLAQVVLGRIAPRWLPHPPQRQRRSVAQDT